MNARYHLRAAVLVAAVIGATWSAVASAQGTAEEATLDAPYEEAFRRSFEDPSDLDTSFRFAELAVRSGDLEGAIGALERMLLYNPDLPRVRLELGVLYFRLASYEIASTYMVRAIEGEDVPETVRARVATYLAEIDRRRARHRYSGSIYGGVRYQSNANAGPDTPAVRFAGLPATLATEATKRSDDNLFLSGTLRHVFDFQTQGGEVLESNLLAYGTRQREQGELDLGLVEVNSGPRGQFTLGRLDAIGYRPYFVGSVVTLGDLLYLWTVGGGLTLTRSFGKRLALEINYEHRHRVFRSSRRRPVADLQSGDEDILRLGARYLITPDLSFRVLGSIKNEGARNQIFGDREGAVTASLTQTYDAPVPFRGRWTSTASFSFVHTRFHAIDPVIDPGTRRVDRELRYLFLTRIPLWKALSLVATVQWNEVDSSLPNFEFDNTAISIGLSWRF